MVFVAYQGVGTAYGVICHRRVSVERPENNGRLGDMHQASNINENKTRELI